MLLETCVYNVRQRTFDDTVAGMRSREKEKRGERRVCKSDIVIPVAVAGGLRHCVAVGLITCEISSRKGQKIRRR